MSEENIEVHKSFLEGFRLDTILQRLGFVSSLVDRRYKFIHDAVCGNGLTKKFLSESAMYLGIDFNEMYIKSLWRGKNFVPRIEDTMIELPTRR